MHVAKWVFTSKHVLNQWRDLQGHMMRSQGRQGQPPPPKFIVFYRDGVSDGELDRVATEEYAKIISLYLKSI